MCSNDVTSLLQAPGVGDRRASRPPPAGGETCWRDRTWGGFAGDWPWFQTGREEMRDGRGRETGSCVEPVGMRIGFSSGELR